MRTTVTVTVRVDGIEQLVEITVTPTVALEAVARALQLDPRHLRLDGVALASTTPAADVLAPGVTLESAPTPAFAIAPAVSDEPSLVVSGGLHAGRATSLQPAAPTRIGRGTAADLRIPCPTVSPLHATASWDDAGATVVDAGGRNGIRWVDGGHHVDTALLTPARELALGASRIRFVPGSPSDRLLVPPPAAPDGRCTVDRARQPPRPTAPPPLSVPVAPPRLAGYSPFSWALFLGPLVVGGLMALLLNPLMAAFAALSPVMVLASWLEGRRRSRRGARHAQRRLRGEIAQFAHRLEERRRSVQADRRDRHPDPGEVVRRALTPSRSLWARRSEDDDWLKVRVGTGSIAWQAPVGPHPEQHPSEEIIAVLGHATCLHEVPVTLPAGELGVIGMAGPISVIEPAARSWLVDAATHQGPADLGILIETDQPDRWAWCRWLPHHTDDVEPGDRHLLLVTDRTSPLRPGTTARAVLDRPGGRSTVVVLDEQGDALPDRCEVVVHARDELGTATVEAGPAHLRAWDLLLDGLDHSTADRAARALGRLRDPEHRADRRLPHLLRSADLGGERLTAAAVSRQWEASDPNCLDLVLGATHEGLFTVDLVGAGPHALVGGTTGAGKSELLRTLVAGLAASHPPDHVTFVLVDYKGGSAFDACADLPHTVGLVTDLDGRLGDRAIRSLDAEIRRREQVLRDAGASDLAALEAHTRERPGSPPLPRLVVVVDEFAALARDLPHVIDALVDVARRGRSLGLHLVLATQRPAGVISDQIRTNTNLRIALRMVDPTDSADVVGDASAVRLPADAPGRAIVCHSGSSDEVQVLCVSLPEPPEVHVRGVDDPEMATGPAATGATDLATIVHSATAAWSHRSSTRPDLADALRRPWLEPLPSQLTPSELPSIDSAMPRSRWCLGLADDPDRQRRATFSWHPDDGAILLYGTTGSGCTTALRSLVLSGSQYLGPTELHVYVIGSRAEWADLEELPQVGAVIEPTHATRLDRLIDLVRTAACSPAPAARVLLVLDGVRSALDAIDHLGGIALVDEMVGLLTRAAPGLALAASTDRISAVPGALTAAIPRKVCFRLPEVYDYAAFSLRPVDARTLPPGRGFDVSSGLEIQVARHSDLSARRSTGTRTGPRPDGWPDSLSVLPSTVRRRDLPSSQPHPPGTIRTVMGLADRPREPVLIDLAEGEHLLVTGPSGSGRSTVLASLAADNESVVVTGAPRSPLRTRPDTARLWRPFDRVAQELAGTEHPVLLLIDDADLVDDVDGHFGGLLAGTGPIRVVATVHHERVRTRYGHWSSPMGTGRLGLALCPRPDDGEVWATTLPRRPTAGWPPGRGYLVDHGRPRLLQVAMP